MNWKTIDSLPKEEKQVLACTADGRIMIWNTDILGRVMSGKQPFHLQFPATHWMELPEMPS